MKDIYDRVYSQDIPKGQPGEAFGRVLWRLTHVYIDLHCKCGHVGHCEGADFHYYRCALCKTEYAVGRNVTLIELTQEQAHHVESQNWGHGLVADDENINP